MQEPSEPEALGVRATPSVLDVENRAALTQSAEFEQQPRLQVKAIHIVRVAELGKRRFRAGLHVRDQRLQDDVSARWRQGPCLVREPPGPRSIAGRVEP